MKTIPYGHQCINQDDVREVVGALNSEWITQGPKIAEFESALCDYAGVKFAVAVSSGTAALHIAALSAGLRRGDEAITSPITFAASANCILYCGAKPIFADIQPETGNIDPIDIVKKITRKSKVLVPVHFAGYPCDMQEIAIIARKNDLLIIEDAAHALGARYKGSKIGSCKYSDMAILSFHPVKAITTGEGGAVLTNNKRLYQRLLMLRNHGITKDSKSLDRKMRYCGWYYEMQELGFNYRLTDIQSALGISQLKKLDFFIEKRRKIAVTYNKAFNGNHFFDVPKENKDVFCAYHLYPIRLKKDLELKRDGIFKLLRDKKIGVQVHYIPVYLHPYYKKLGFKKGICPAAEDFYHREISLPIYPALTSREIQYIINTVFEVCNRHKNG
ncbi:MAG: UDP-4-amino-4,6-dideoxy-N-acetyl-beta-L-altrosamine transaminase [Candidatus Omnitrophica bacterium]|nr:UDP-4-amino-4,6-dideoxy-N-acetyl-beta-L-altrosamine transaminase [Candidatus Omnitrophota bacterium]